MNDKPTKIISEIDLGDNIVSVKPPFRMEEDKKRRYIRLEISEPIALVVMKDRDGGFWPDGDGAGHEGRILNISAGGVLVEGTGAIEEGTLVVIKLSLHDVEIIDNIIGLVKRSELDGDAWLTGIEFLPRECLADHFSAAELNLIPTELASFGEQLRKTLNRYVYYRRVSGGDR